MDIGTFYDGLNWMVNEDALNLIDEEYYDLYMDPHPEFVLQRFYDVINEDGADMLAQMFTSQIGDIVICRQESNILGHFVTIMDILKADMWKSQNWPGKLLIFKTFQRYGFKYAHECDQRILYDLYTDCPSYESTVGTIQIFYDYELLKQERAELAEDLHKYLYHPDKIYKWILSGHDLEDYLN